MEDLTMGWLSTTVVNQYEAEIERLKLTNNTLRSQVSELVKKSNKQREEITRLEKINKARKEVIKMYAHMRDELKDYVLYSSAVLDCYGHKDKATIGFELKTLFSPPSTKKILESLNKASDREDSSQ